MTTSIALSPHFENFIREQIDSGRYNNVSEVIRAGLRALEEREHNQQLEMLQAAVKAGINSGEGRDAKEVFDRLTAKYRRMAENGKKK